MVAYLFELSPLWTRPALCCWLCTTRSAFPSWTTKQGPDLCDRSKPDFEACTSHMFWHIEPSTHAPQNVRALAVNSIEPSRSIESSGRMVPQPILLACTYVFHTLVKAMWSLLSPNPSLPVAVTTYQLVTNEQSMAPSVPKHAFLQASPLAVIIWFAWNLTLYFPLDVVTLSKISNQQPNPFCRSTTRRIMFLKTNPHTPKLLRICGNLHLFKYWIHHASSRSNHTSTLATTQNFVCHELINF